MKPEEVQTDFVEAIQILVRAIKLGHGKRDKNYFDDKELISLNEFKCLLNAGGMIIYLNAESCINYIHEIIYQEHTFICITSEKITL